MNVLFVSSEIAPFNRGSALGEFVGELPVATAGPDVTVTVVAPYRPEIAAQQHGLARRLQKVDVVLAGREIACGLYEGPLRTRDTKVWFVDPQSDSQAPENGHFGGENDGARDDHESCFLLAQAALQLCADRDLELDLVHCVGWQSGFVPLLLRRSERYRNVPVVFTIDDPTQTGCFAAEILEKLGLGYDDFNPDGIEFHGRVSLLKAGIVFADRVTVLSPSIADDIQREGHGAGLHGLYEHRKNELHGVLPGIDQTRWNPQNDRHLPAAYGLDDQAGKAEAKAALQQRLALRRRPASALVVCTGPFRGGHLLDALLARAEDLLELKLQLVFAGQADDDAAAALRRFAAGRGERVAYATVCYDDETWHELLAGADALLPTSDAAESIFLILRALRYGTIPIAPDRGALGDVLVDFDAISRTGTGFCYAAGQAGEKQAGEKQADAITSAVHRMTATYSVPERWHVLVANALRQDVGWERAAALFREIYGQLQS